MEQKGCLKNIVITFEGEPIPVYDDLAIGPGEINCFIHFEGCSEQNRKGIKKLITEMFGKLGKVEE